MPTKFYIEKYVNEQVFNVGVTDLLYKNFGKLTYLI